MEQSTFLLEEHPVNHSQLQGLEKALMTHEATSCLHILPLLNNISPSGWFGKTSPAYCQATEEKILEPSSQRWGKSGTGFHGESWTLNTSEYHKDAAVCSLSDVLESGEVQQKFFLSSKACLGILRRAERRLKVLPLILESALRECAALETTPVTAPQAH